MVAAAELFAGDGTRVVLVGGPDAPGLPGGAEAQIAEESAKDPNKKLRNWIIENGLAEDDEIGALEAQIKNEIDEAADRATAMLGATKPPSERVTVVLDRPVVAAFLGIVSGMLGGDRVVKGRSPFAERLGDVVVRSARLERVHAVARQHHDRRVDHGAYGRHTKRDSLGQLAEERLRR